MIKIPQDIISPEELSDASGRKVKDIDIEITGLTIERSTMELVLDIKLNFVMPRNLEAVMKERIIDKIGYVSRVRINYMYAGIQIPDNPVSESSSQRTQRSGGGYEGGGERYRSRRQTSRYFGKCRFGLLCFKNIKRTFSMVQWKKKFTGCSMLSNNVYPSMRII